MCVTSPDIFVQEAKHNNLKAIDFSITLGELTVITGLSGSGKSTLLFDVLHAEGQRRYVETFSPMYGSFWTLFRDLKSKTSLMPGLPLQLSRKLDSEFKIHRRNYD